jgi:hypothetical protein
MLHRALKFFHEIGAAGMMGSLGACLALTAAAPTRSIAGYVEFRQAIGFIMHWILMPSLAAVLVSGLLAIAANSAYHNTGWVWLKALLGISMFEGSLLTVGASTQRAAELSAAVASGHVDPNELTRIVHGEWGTMWLLLALSVVNVALAVWRPRFIRGARPAPTG